MSKIAIRAENLGKEFAIGRTPNRHPTLRDFVVQAVKEPFLRMRNVLRGQGAQTYQDTFWALKDVSFEVEAGTVIGVIGRNGSGKSTLLKILSRITDPNEGFAELYGRVGSLLEVGTGFHPDLTGRENIFMNGSMLGMRRQEIRLRFDEIVAFSEVEKFLDTPVKHYSSGMYMRLAFAVAAYLDPEILIVDEVLSVGDAAFQKKCLEKLEAVSKNGRTVLVVSHSLPVIQTKCQSCIWLDQGRLRGTGKTAEVLTDFVKTLNVLQNSSLEERGDRQGSGAIRFLRVGLQDGRGNDVASLVTGEDAVIVLQLANTTGRRLHHVDICFYVEDSANNRLTSLMNRVLDRAVDSVDAGTQTVSFRVPRLPLVGGRYHYTLACEVNGALADSVQNAGVFHVEGGDFYGSGKPLSAEQGAFLLDYSFDVDGKLTAAA
jgi:lipopolysaccharide transport system ATP-binding protein